MLPPCLLAFRTALGMALRVRVGTAAAWTAAFGLDHLGAVTLLLARPKGELPSIARRAVGVASAW